jgi:hypothetical protein
MADRFVVIATTDKLVERLADSFPLPIEVVPFAVGPVTRSLVARRLRGGRCAPGRGPGYRDRQRQRTCSTPAAGRHRGPGRRGGGSRCCPGVVTVRAVRRPRRPRPAGPTDAHITGAVRRRRARDPRSLSRSSGGAPPPAPGRPDPGPEAIGDDGDDALEVVHRAELDRQLALAGAHRDAHPRLSASERSSWSSSSPGARRALRRGHAVSARRRAAAAGRAPRSRAPTALGDDALRDRACSAGSSIASSALAWPALSTPAATRRWTAAGSCSSRRALLMAGSDLAEPGASSSWVNAELLEQLLVGGGLLERVELHPVDVLDQRLLQQVGVLGVADHTGTSSRPASLAARSRRSPAISSYRPPPGAHDQGLQHADVRQRVASPRAPRGRRPPGAGGGSG